MLPFSCITRSPEGATNEEEFMMGIMSSGKNSGTNNDALESKFDDDDDIEIMPLSVEEQLEEMTQVARHLQAIVIQNRVEREQFQSKLEHLQADNTILESSSDIKLTSSQNQLARSPSPVHSGEALPVSTGSESRELNPSSPVDQFEQFEHRWNEIVNQFKHFQKIFGLADTQDASNDAHQADAQTPVSRPTTIDVIDNSSEDTSPKSRSIDLHSSSQPDSEAPVLNCVTDYNETVTATTVTVTKEPSRSELSSSRTTTTLGTVATELDDIVWMRVALALSFLMLIGAVIVQATLLAQQQQQADYYSKSLSLPTDIDDEAVTPVADPSATSDTTANDPTTSVLAELEAAGDSLALAVFFWNRWLRATLLKLSKQWGHLMVERHRWTITISRRVTELNRTQHHLEHAWNSVSRASQGVAQDIEQFLRCPKHYFPMQ